MDLRPDAGQGNAPAAPLGFGQGVPAGAPGVPTASNLNWPGGAGEVRYGEGIFVGYRYYEKKKIAPLFPFGHGLSYTTFQYGPLALSASESAPIRPVPTVSPSHTARVCRAIC